MGYDDMDEALALLMQALRHHEAGSPRQQLAWEQGASKLPEQLRNAMPPFARLMQLAEQAWPSNQK